MRLLRTHERSSSSTRAGAARVAAGAAQQLASRGAHRSRLPRRLLLLLRRGERLRLLLLDRLLLERLLLDRERAMPTLLGRWRRRVVARAPAAAGDDISFKPVQAETVPHCTSRVGPHAGPACRGAE